MIHWYKWPGIHFPDGRVQMSHNRPGLRYEAIRSLGEVGYGKGLAARLFLNGPVLEKCQFTLNVNDGVRGDASIVGCSSRREENIEISAQEG
jgi:hypothetical protein